MNQSENLDASPEQAFNRLIKSQWKKTQRKESKSQSIASTEDKDSENSITLFERWFPEDSGIIRDETAG